MSIRHEVAALLQASWDSIEELPTIHVVATERELDDLHNVTVQIRGNSIGTLPEAPLSHRSVKMSVIVISAHDDPDMATDELDEIVPLMLDVLDERFRHEDAELTRYGQSMAYLIPLTVIASKD